MRASIIAGIFAAAAFAAGALAQTPMHNAPADQFEFKSAKDVDALTDKPGPGAHTAYLGDHENFYVEYASRNDSGNEAEVHAHWTHHIHILSGAATLTWGGTVTSPRETGPGQVRGPAIAAGTQQPVHEGDYIQIPAGTAHMFTVPAGGKLHYVVFNTRQ